MATDTQTNINKEVDQGILRNYLGISDGSDIDFGTYKTLIREKIAAARMGDSDADSGDIEVLTKEFIRIKKIKIPEDQEKSKIDAKKFFAEQEKAAKKVAEDSNEDAEKISSQKFFDSANKIKTDQQKVSSTLLIPSSTEPQEEKKDSVDNEEVKKGIDQVSLKLTDLEENLKSILDTLKKQAKLDKKEEREEDALEIKNKRASREKLLESKGKKPGDDKNLTKKVVKPAKGIFDMLMDFFKNILLGGALLFLLKVLKDPKKFLQPLIDAFNKVLEFFNGIIRGVNGFIDGFNNFVLSPINDFILKPINSSLNFIEDRINDVLGLFGADPLENIPDEPPSLEIPKIPEIPPYDPFKVLPEGATTATPPPVQQSYQGGEVIQNTYTTNTYNQGGNVSNNSGVNIKGAGPDTQLIAAQPGEIVMSRGAVNKFGADNLLAMNAAGGGNNIPRMNTNIQMANGGGSVINAQGFSGGGLVGGTAGANSPDRAGGKAKKTKVFLHWTGGSHNSNVGPYHQVFSGSGKPMRTAQYGVDNADGTGGYNTNSIALAAAAMGHGSPTKPYSDSRGWRENPLTNAQTTAMAKETAGILKAYGQTAADVDKNVMTHGEIERQGVKSGKLSGGVQRWDLDSLNPGPYKHPDGFFSTRQVKSTGGNQMRSKIKSFMGVDTTEDTSTTQGMMPTNVFSSAEGVSATNFQLFTIMGSESRNKILMSKVGDKVDGVTVTESMRKEVKTYNLKKSDFDKMTLAATSSVKNPAETAGTSAPATISSTQTRKAPGPRTVKTNVIMSSNQNGKIPQGATPTSLAGNANGNRGVPSFSSQDSMNTETLIIKSIYSLVG